MPIYFNLFAGLRLKQIYLLLSLARTGQLIKEQYNTVHALTCPLWRANHDV